MEPLMSSRYHLAVAGNHEMTQTLGPRWIGWIGWTFSGLEKLFMGHTSGEDCVVYSFIAVGNAVKKGHDL